MGIDMQQETNLRNEEKYNKRSMEEKCGTHPNFAPSFICLSPECKETSTCCVVCVRGIHKSCPDRFIFRKGFLSQSRFTPVASDLQGRLAPVLSSLREDFCVRTSRTVEGLHRGVSQVFAAAELTWEDFATARFLRSAKENFRILADKPGDTIVIRPNAAMPSGKTLGRKVKLEVEKVVSDFRAEDAKVGFTIFRKILNADLYRLGPGMQLLETPEGLEFRSKECEKNFSFAMLKTPLEDAFVCLELLHNIVKKNQAFLYVIDASNEKDIAKISLEAEPIGSISKKFDIFELLGISYKEVYVKVAGRKGTIVFFDSASAEITAKIPNSPFVLAIGFKQPDLVVRLNNLA